jgi:hypothetical protein
MRPLARFLDRSAVTTLLQRNVSVQLVNISRTGCLLMAPSTIRIGSVGRLRIVLDSTSYFGDVRVVRSEGLNGAVRRVGVEFMWRFVPEDVGGAPAFRSS